MVGGEEFVSLVLVLEILRRPAPSSVVINLSLIEADFERRNSGVGDEAVSSREGLDFDGESIALQLAAFLGVVGDSDSELFPMDDKNFFGEGIKDKEPDRVGF